MQTNGNGVGGMLRTALAYAALGLASGVLGGMVSCSQTRNVSEDDAASEWAKTICRLLFQCECRTNHADREACEQARDEDFGQKQQQAQEAELEYDGKCLGSILEDYDALGCDSDLEGDARSCEVCSVYHGDVAAGEPCTVTATVNGLGQFSDCAQGLLCIAGACVDLCARLGEGEACSPTEQFPRCDEQRGLYCNPVSSECERFPTEGDPCGPMNPLCGPGLVCDFQSMQCAPLPRAGEACPLMICAEGLVCVDMTCEPLPRNGEDCVSNVCAEGLVCNDENVCVPPPSEGEPCIQQQCASHLRCNTSGTCEPRDPLVCSR